MEAKLDEKTLVQRMIGNAFLNFHSVDDWVASETAPDTFELDSPRGKLYLTKSRPRYARLVAAGEVVFSPLEVERFIELAQKCKLARAERLEAGEEEGPAAISERLIDLIYQLKTMDPGAKLYEMKLDVDEMPDCCR